MENKLKIGVFGSGEYEDKDKIYRILDKNIDKIKFVVSNDNKGPSKTVQEWAKERGAICVTCHAMTHINGIFDKSSGYKNNHRAIKICDVVMIFNKDNSRGATLIEEMANDLQKDVRVIRV